MGLRAIREGLQARLDNITGIRPYDHVKGSVNPPMAEVGFPTNVNYDITFGPNASEWTIPVRVYVGQASNRAATEKLDELVSATGDTTSVKAAIEGDKTLGGACMSAIVTRMTGAGAVDVGGISYLVADFEVEVIAL